MQNDFITFQTIDTKKVIINKQYVVALKNVMKHTQIFTADGKDYTVDLPLEQVAAMLSGNAEQSAAGE